MNWSRTIIQTCITTALHAEARPLIEHFKLKQDTTSHAVRIYRSESVSLTVGGVGKVKSAVAATCLLAQTPLLGRVTALNIGIAGCTQEKNADAVQIGDLFLINKIIDLRADCGRNRSIRLQDVLAVTHRAQHGLFDLIRTLRLGGRRVISENSTNERCRHN